MTVEYGITNLDYVLDGKGLAVVRDTSSVDVVWPGIAPASIAPVACTGPAVASWPLSKMETSRGAGGKLVHCGWSGAANVFEVTMSTTAAYQYT